jgi:hypothetical protein
MNEVQNEFQTRVQMIEIGEKVCKQVFNMIFQYGACLLDFDEENDLSKLTTYEIMNKVRDVIVANPKDVNKMCFFEYLAKYPVSMCKRDVSPLLKQLIGFHYRLGVPTEQQKANGAEKVSYDDLSEIFGRSKATISECVNETETTWNEVQKQAELEREAEEEAKRQLVADKKKKLAEEEQNEGTNGKQANERCNTP